MNLFNLLLFLLQHPGPGHFMPHFLFNQTQKSCQHVTAKSIMQVQFLNRVVSLSGGNRVFARHNPPPIQLQHIPHQTLEMVTESGHSKRPMCPSCSKPTHFCLCTRLKTPCLQNSVAVTILQHSLEKKHPLNSTRIASIGLQNLSVISVSDVNYQAQFVIHLLNSNLEMGSQNLEKKTSIKYKDSNFDSILEMGSQDFDEKSSISNKDSNFSHNADIHFTIEKYGTICSLQGHDLSEMLACRAATHDLRKGFLVKKLQRKLRNGSSDEIQELEEEFELVVPQGSVLLFPSENSIGMEDIGFEVKNLIVLDGTWAKANRMYNENPWLKVLPHVRLDVEKLSLYSEVRHQPKAGYLSTIESIVYALKAVGEEDCEGLDQLLDVFESMVGDQRRCKDERLRQSLSS